MGTWAWEHCVNDVASGFYLLIPTIFTPSPVLLEESPESPPPISYTPVSDESMFTTSPIFFENARESPPPLSYTPVPQPNPQISLESDTRILPNVGSVYYYWCPPPPQYYWSPPPPQCHYCAQRSEMMELIRSREGFSVGFFPFT
ncbi:uncharacterized protein LOC135392451 [Ornithodoros turicata]|uniref:uncharacterized protein LOC135392451 n=1 Tax=Ornithodoros turicata TaxID=34597 RepID=UPI00313A13C5